MITPTQEQQAIVDGVAAGPAGPSAPSILISAAAGCAKTTTLGLAAKGVKGFALALAFNKKIAQDLQRTLPSHFESRTMNALGHRAWASRAEGPIKLDDKKLGRLTTEVTRDWKLSLAFGQWDSLRRLVSQAMASGLVPVGAEGSRPSLIPDNRSGWLLVAEEMGLFLDDFDLLWEPAREILQRSITQAKAGIISFDDQIYCPVMLGGQLPAFSTVFVDEFQDLSPLQIEMLSRVVRPGGRIIAAGDPRQAIYHWRGASGDAGQLIQGLRPEWSNLPLLTTFRCPRVVVSRQQSHVPGFAPWPEAAEGHFLDLTKPSAPWSGLSILQANPNPSHPVAILCRNNAPLLSLAFRLIRQGSAVSMLGRDIGKGLGNLVKKVCKGAGQPSAIPMGKFLSLLSDWEAQETGRALAEDKPHLIASIEDRAECLRAVASGTGAQHAGQILGQIEALFSRPEGAPFVLSSIHRAKGQEWPLVVHLDPWRVPSKQALRANAKGNPIPLAQERNLLYVCETRTKHTLINANLEDFTND